LGGVSDIAEALRALANDESELTAGLGAGERAYTVLRVAIVRDALPARTLLNEAELAASLDISRTPVRTALQMLLQEGLVEVGARRQLYVRDFAPAERNEVIRLREALERVAVVEACRTIELHEIDQLRLTLIRQRRATDQGDVETFIDLDDQFHLGLAMGARLPTLQKFLGQLRAYIRMMGLRVATQQGRMYEVLDEHEAIVAAVEAGDEQAARAALDSHLSRTYELLEDIEHGAAAGPASSTAR
jgi:DNA-binding GntR family transcriptional regulator